MSSAFMPPDRSRPQQGGGFADLFETNRAKVAEQTPVVSPEKVKLIYEKAYKDGYERGMNEGHLNALEAGKHETAGEQRLLLQLLGNFQQLVDRKNVETSEDLLNLAVDSAKAMIRVKLETDPEVCLPIISEAIGSLPSLQSPLRLSLNPADVEVVTRHMMDDLRDLGWVLVEDHTIERGGCAVQTATNTVDATNANRWRRICDALGRSNDWLETSS